MKLLLDENLSPRLVSTLAPYWPDSVHVETAGLRRATDETIWRLARDHGFAILSKDDDFSSLALVRGAPPKVIWLQIGNAPTSVTFTPFALKRVNRLFRPWSKIGRILVLAALQRLYSLHT